MWSEKFYCGECDPYAIGARLVGTVVLTKPIGAYISLASGIDGLLHISEIRKLIGGRRVVSVDDVVTIGSELLVEVIEVEQSGLIRLSPVLSVTEPTGG
jgi:polyribonucleotide nucleotidyltransferase